MAKLDVELGEGEMALIAEIIRFERGAEKRNYLNAADSIKGAIERLGDEARLEEAATPEAKP